MMSTNCTQTEIGRKQYLAETFAARTVKCMHLWDLFMLEPLLGLLFAASISLEVWFERSWLREGLGCPEKVRCQHNVHEEEITRLVSSGFEPGCQSTNKLVVGSR